MQTKNNIIFLIVVTFISSIVSAQEIGRFSQLRLGINVCGAEFGEKNMPGVYGTDYIYPTDSTIYYFARKGFTLLVLPFKWERIQPILGGELDSTELKRIKTFVSTCSKAKVDVTLTMQNFAAYRIADKEYTIGSNKISVEYFKDVWQKIATAFLRDTNIYGYDIMNEPRKIFGKGWFNAAQKAINGIRNVDSAVHIIIDGENGSHSYDWKFENDHLKNLVDSSNKIIYDAHCYFDYNHSGRYKYEIDRKIDPKIGIESVKPFVEWLKKNNKKGLIGEFGVPPEPHWLKVMDNFLNYLFENGVTANYWAAGPWWHDYILSVEPNNGKDKPQMEVLEKYIFFSSFKKK